MANVSRTLFLWSVALGAGAIAAKGPALTTIPAIALGAASGMVAYQSSGKHGAREWASELGEVGLELCTLTPADGPSSATPSARLISALPPSVADWLNVATVDPTSSEFWTPKRARASKIYVGARGSGKSVLVGFHCAQMAEAGVDLKISDRHYPESQEWLPGLDRAVFEERYLLRTAEDSHRALLHLQEVLHNRIEGLSPDRSPKHLVIDEWGGLVRKWSAQEIKSAIDAIGFIYDEGRKYGIDVSLVCHGLTREKTHLDESITGSADLFLMGDALAQSTYTYPLSLSRERGKLLDSRAQLVATVQHPQRVLTYRDALSGEAYPVVSPDLSTPERLEVEPSTDQWLVDNADAITAMVLEGKTARQISTALKIRRAKNNPQWVLLQEFITEVTANV